MRVATMLLSYDHGIIQQVVDVLGEAVKRQTVDKYAKQVIEIVEFLSRFMDKFHHGKEEQFLFPLAITSFSSLKPEIEKLISEHQYPESFLIGASNIETRKDINNAHESIYLLVEHITAHIDKRRRTFTTCPKNLPMKYKTKI